MRFTLNSFSIVLFFPLFVFQGCLGFSTSSLREGNQRKIDTIKAVSAWEGEYSGMVTINDSINKPNFDGSGPHWYKEEVTKYIPKKDNPSTITITTTDGHILVKLVGDDKSFSWNFTVKSSEFSSLSADFPSTMLFLGQMRNCHVSLNLLKNKLNGKITIEPKERIIVAASTIIERKPGAEITLFFERNDH